MKVNHQVQALRFSAKGFSKHIGLVAPWSIAVLGIDPHAQTDGIQPNFLHKSKKLSFLAIEVIELHTVGFKFGAPTNISATGKTHLRIGIVTFKYQIYQCCNIAHINLTIAIHIGSIGVNVIARAL